MTNHKNATWLKIAILMLIVVLVTYFLLHRHTKVVAAPLPLPVVVVAHPELRDMADYITQTGTTVAYNSVNLVARIEGYLQAVNFVDGSFVKKGKELFIIEPAPYLAKLKEAQATVEAQKAGYAYAKAEYARQQRMYKENATSLNNVQKWLAKGEESKAEVDKAVANADIAAINYSYTHVLAPFDGRIGRHLVDPGNLVGNGKATDLATIEQIDPLYVYFNPNELDLIKLRNAARARGVKPMKLSKIPVHVGMQNETDFPHAGTLDFINTGLNSSTGTMELRALLPNKNYDLLPGLFVQIRIAISKPKPQLTVPDTAIQYDQIGAYLLTVNPKNNVDVKRVVVGSLEQGRRAITKGISAQDNVIISGLQNATPGNPVKLQQKKLAS